MKVFLDTRGLKDASITRLKQTFPDVLFLNQEEDYHQADVLFCFPDFASNLKLEKFKNLKWLQLYTAGFDTVDLGYLRARGIAVTNGKGVYSKTIAEDVLTKVLALNRNVGFYYEQMKSQTWQHLKNEVELTGSIVGIVGAGSIGIEIAKRFKAFETTVIGHKRTHEKVEYFDEILTGEDGLKDLLSRSDYVILALPLNESSYHLFDLEKFRLMKSTAVLVNIARGEVIKQEDLVRALEEDLIRGVALDVTTPEPLPQDHPLWRFKQVFITPHNAMSSPLLAPRLVELLIQNLKTYLATGKTRNIVKE